MADKPGTTLGLLVAIPVVEQVAELKYYRVFPLTTNFYDNPMQLVECFFQRDDLLEFSSVLKVVGYQVE